MKYYILVFFMSLGSSLAYGQWPNPENERLSANMMNFMNTFAGGGFEEYSASNIDNYSIPEQQHLTYTEIYFQKRQINMYYKHLEAAQKQEINALKKNKNLTIQEVKRIYGRGY